MNVLLLSPLPPPSGGIARWTERYLDWCIGKNEVDIVNTALIGRRTREAGVKKKLTEELKRAYYIVRETEKKLKHKPDVVHLNTSCSMTGIIRDFICVKKAIKYNVPIITHCHCNIQDQLGNGKIPTKLFRYIVNVSVKVLVLNEPSKEYVEKVSTGKAYICPNFVIANLIVNEHTIRKDLKSIVYVGDVSFSKGTDDIYKLASVLPDKTFVIVGSVTEEIKCLYKPENVILLGRLEADEVYRQMDQADAFLFPSLSEGFSNALLEAMARGLPIIATDVGANKDMIGSEGGIIVPIHDMNSMKMAIEKMESMGIRRKMSKWNIQKVRANYECNIVMNQIMKIYGGL